MKLKLAHSLYLAFGLVLAILVLFSILVYTQQKDILKISAEVESDDVPGAMLYMQVLDEMGDMQTNVLEYLNGEYEESQDFESNYQEFRGFFKQLVPLESAKQSDRDKMDLIESLSEQYANVVRTEIFAKYKPEQEQKAYKAINDLEKTTGKALEELLDQLKDEEFNDALKSTDLQESLNDDLPGVRYYLELVDQAGDMLSSIIKYVAGDASRKEDFQKDKESFAYYLELIKPLEKKPQEVKNIALIQQYFDEITQTAAEIFKNYDPQTKIDALRTVDDLEKQVFNKMEEILDTSAEEERSDASMALTGLTEQLNSMITKLIIITLVAVALGFFIAWYLSSRITSRVNLVVEKAKLIAEGDLSSPISEDTSGDELGMLARSIDDMQSSLKTLISEISAVAGQVASESDALESVSRQVSQGSQDQAHKAQLIATAVEQMTATVNEVAEQSSMAATLAQQAGEQADNGGVIMQQTVSSIQKVSTVVNDSAAAVDELGKRGEEIGQIIKVITDIAEQTNLLALKAAIEAARAGEFGRGFSVVADEVRGLAERTAKATKQVAESINATQTETTKAVARMDEGTELVNQGVKLTEEAGDALRSIVDNAKNVNSMIHSIAAATEEQSVATREIASDIVFISDVASETVSLAGSANDASARLSDKVTQLEGLVAKFKL